VAKNKDVSTVHFLVDDKTTVEGKLAVGAQASVEYRSDEGKSIAVRVIVTPASGMSYLFKLSKTGPRDVLCPSGISLVEFCSCNKPRNHWCQGSSRRLYRAKVKSRLVA
jgi:hypothetical protein